MPLKNIRLSSAALLTTLSLSACSTVQSDKLGSLKLPYTVTAYNVQYAKDFKLNPETASTLPQGLAAIKLTLEALYNNQGQPFYRCISTLYLRRAQLFT